MFRDVLLPAQARALLDRGLSGLSCAELNQLNRMLLQFGCVDPSKLGDDDQVEFAQLVDKHRSQGALDAPSEKLLVKYVGEVGQFMFRPYMLNFLWPSTIGLLVALTVGYVVSLAEGLITKEPDDERLEWLFLRQRQQWREAAAGAQLDTTPEGSHDTP